MATVLAHDAFLRVTLCLYLASLCDKQFDSSANGNSAFHNHQKVLTSAYS